MQDTRTRPLVIVKAGSTLKSLRAGQGDFEDWIAKGLGAGLPVQVVDPRHEGALPAPGTVGAAVVTGSHAMVSDREPWSEATGAWLAALVALGTPVLGICYGHQLLAHALGGQADYHPQGIEIGTVTVELTEAAGTDPLLCGLPRHFDANEVHRQSALRLPPGATLLARNGHDAHQAFRVGDCAWGVQFHPEFDMQAMRGYVDAMADDLRAEGADPERLRAGVRPTPVAASLLGRFARLAQERALNSAMHCG
jgi:GMP synthase (glutamine-hydrolysing)